MGKARPESRSEQTSRSLLMLGTVGWRNYGTVRAGPNLPQVWNLRLRRSGTGGRAAPSEKGQTGQSKLGWTTRKARCRRPGGPHNIKRGGKLEKLGSMQPQRGRGSAGSIQKKVGPANRKKNLITRDQTRGDTIFKGGKLRTLQKGAKCRRSIQQKGWVRGNLNGRTNRLAWAPMTAPN